LFSYKGGLWFLLFEVVFEASFRIFIKILGFCPAHRLRVIVHLAAHNWRKRPLVPFILERPLFL